MATNYPASCVRANPRNLVRRNPPTVFIHPKISSTPLRLRWGMVYTGGQVVRPSIARDRVAVWSRATCGATPSVRTAVTHALMSYPLSGSSDDKRMEPAPAPSPAALELRPAPPCRWSF